MGLFDRAKSSVRARVTAAALLVALVVATIGAFLFVTTLRNALELGLVTSATQEVESVQAQLQEGEPPDQAVSGAVHGVGHEHVVRAK